MAKKQITTNVDEELFTETQIIAATLHRPTNDLIEEGMRMVRKKYAGDREIIPKLEQVEPEEK